MVVKAMYEFEFDPDTSKLDGVIDDKKGFALDLAKRELDSMLDDKCIDSRDFHFIVIDDKNDHSIESPEQTKPTARTLKSKEAAELFDYLESKIPIASNGVNINNEGSSIEQKYFIPYSNYAEDHVTTIKRTDMRSGFNDLDTCFDVLYAVPENNYRYDDVFADCNATFYDVYISKHHGVISVCKTHYNDDGFIDDKMFITDTTQYINAERIDQNQLINSMENIHDHADEINSICGSCLNYLQTHDVL